MLRTPIVWSLVVAAAATSGCQLFNKSCAPNYAPQACAPPQNGYYPQQPYSTSAAYPPAYDGAVTPAAPLNYPAQ